MDNNQPIIVKRVKKAGAGHHGGAWKIAFADFATAMMAFFLVMWLMTSATPEQKLAISGYFQDPIGFSESASPYVIDLGGTPTPAPDKTLNPELTVPQDKAATNAPETPQEAMPSDAEQAEKLAEQLERERLELLLQELQNKVNENPELQKFREQILFDITRDGLRIQIRDAENRPMFALGSAELQPYFEDILLAMVDTLRSVPNKLSISGHTDAKPFAGRSGFGNWELSAGRANAARRVLEFGGYPEQNIARVVGYASTALFDPANPLNPTNRRIEILVLNRKAQQSIESGQSPEGGGAVPPPAAPSQGAAPAPGDAQDLRQRLNVFEEGVLQLQQAR